VIGHDHGVRRCHRLNLARSLSLPQQRTQVYQQDGGDSLGQMKNDTRRSQCHPQRFALRSGIPRSTKTSACSLGETVTHRVPRSERKVLEERGALCRCEGIYVGDSHASNDIKTPKSWKVWYGTLKDRSIHIWTRLRCSQHPLTNVLSDAPMWTSEILPISGGRPSPRSLHFRA